MSKGKSNQPDMFTDATIIKPVAGTDAGMQLDIFGGNHLHQTQATENVFEAVEINHGHESRQTK